MREFLEKNFVIININYVRTSVDSLIFSIFLDIPYYSLKGFICRAA